MFSNISTNTANNTIVTQSGMENLQIMGLHCMTMGPGAVLPC